MMPPVRAVFFDAVGTLINPVPSAADAYFFAGRRHGSLLPHDTVTARFAEAFRAEEAFDVRNGHRTCEEREAERWRKIVSVVLDDVSDPEACFADLYDHFARAENWRSDPGAGDVVDGLRESGIVVGLASNFDRRLHGVAAGLSELANLDHVVVSSEVGWKKPAGAFYGALAEMAACPVHEILFVGDDLENDVLAPRRSGLRALLFDPQNRSGGERIRSLHEVIEFVAR